MELGFAEALAKVEWLVDMKAMVQSLSLTLSGIGMGIIA